MWESHVTPHTEYRVLFRIHLYIETAIFTILLLANTLANELLLE